MTRQRGIPLSAMARRNREKRETRMAYAQAQVQLGVSLEDIAKVLGVKARTVRSYMPDFLAQQERRRLDAEEKLRKKAELQNKHREDRDRLNRDLRIMVKSGWPGEEIARYLGVTPLHARSLLQQAGIGKKRVRWLQGIPQTKGDRRRVRQKAGLRSKAGKISSKKNQDPDEFNPLPPSVLARMPKAAPPKARKR